MKKIFKIIIAILCWIVAIILLLETIKSFQNQDPWGLGFIFYTLPICIIGVLFLIEAIILTKEFINNKCNTNKKME